jgi:hypothetical protein
MNAEVEFDIVSSNDTNDRPGEKNFSLAAAAILHGEQFLMAEKGVSDLQLICSKYESSVYAPYAALVLARRLYREPGEVEFDLKKYCKYLDIIISEHPNHYLQDKAYYMRASGLMREEGLTRERRNSIIYECLDVLKEKHPNSRFINRLKTEYGVHSSFEKALNLTSSNHEKVSSKVEDKNPEPLESSPENNEAPSEQDDRKPWLSWALVVALIMIVLGASAIRYYLSRSK